MSRFKFIHAADLHLESPYKGISHLDESLGKALVKHGVKAYENLIQAALDNKVDFLLIAGDSFDSESGSLSAQYRFVRGMERLHEANIPVFVICGNHDPLDSWSKHLKLPSNVTLFLADEVQQHAVLKDGKALAEIYGVSFGKKEEYRRWAEKFKRNDQAPFSIGLLHGTAAGNEAHTPYCPFTLDNLRASNLDYWALGHIHKREVLQEQNPMVVYPGNIQGRHFKETGEKGCSLVTVEQGSVVAHEFIPLSDIVYAYHTIDVSEMNSISEFFDGLSTLSSSEEFAGKCYLLRLRLVGRCSFHSELSDRNEMENLLTNINHENDYNSSFVFIDKFLNETSPDIDLETRKDSSDFIADLLKRFDYYEKDGTALEKLKSKILQELQGTKPGRAIKLLDLETELNDEGQQLLTSAKWKCLDGLIKNENPA